MSLHDAMREACAAVGITPPRSAEPGRWAQTPVVGKAASNRSGRVLVFDDGRGGIAWNWATGQQLRFSDGGQIGQNVAVQRRDPERDRAREAERAAVAETCKRIVDACDRAEHPYLAAKGFPDEIGLVIEDPRSLMPRGELGDAMAHALPHGDGPFLIVPGRIGGTITTVQVITADGDKKNIKGSQIGGASHRIATGAQTWVCEGIATALSVRAALRLLGRSATVLAAFAANNVCAVASGLAGSVVAADHDKPVKTLGGLGTGEFYALKSGRVWVMPPSLGDFNDMHMSDGLRAVMLRLREVTG